MRAIKSLDSMLFCLHMCSWRLVVNKKIIAKQDTQLQSVLQQKNPQNFLLHQEQLTDLAPSFLCPCQKFLSKKAKFLITMRAIKSFDTIPFVSSCKFRNSCHNERPTFLTQWKQSKVFLLKSTILYMPVSLWRFIVNKQILVFVKTLTITQVDVVVMISLNLQECVVYY